MTCLEAAVVTAHATSEPFLMQSSGNRYAGRIVVSGFDAPGLP
jgi:hypothetical protein